MRHRYAKMETNWFSDPRMMAMSAGEVVAYMTVWALSVDVGSEDLSPECSTRTYIGKRSNQHPRTVESMVKKAQGFSQPLLKVRDDGGLTVCGSAKLHPRIVNQSKRILHIEEKRREEKKREELVAVGEELEDSSQMPPPEKSPNLPELAQEARRLPWENLIPWFAENMHRWSEVKDPDIFASKILVRCIDELGFRWEELEERLRDSSEYLKAHPKKYKSPRGFYWNQVDLYKRRVPPDPKPKRQTDAGEVVWPAGAVRLQSGVFYDSQGNAIKSTGKKPGLMDELIAKTFSGF